MQDSDYGYVKINLIDIIERNNITKNKLSFMAEMQRTQLNNWIKGNISYIDLGVLARLCKALNCNVGDLLKYVPNDFSRK